LLVVIVIISVLVGLLLPGVQAAREAARRSQCLNHVLQIATGVLQHQSAKGFFPSAGWGYSWVGDPDRSSGRTQPGSWIYSTLPYVEQDAVWRLGGVAATGQFDPNGATIDSNQMALAAQQVQTPIPLFNCPSRRAARLLPYQGSALNNASQFTLCARADYGANAGTNVPQPLAPAAAISPWVPWGAGPSSLPTGAQQTSVTWSDMTNFNGIVGQRTEVRPDDIVDGASQTYLLGERYINPDHYLDGMDPTDSQTMYSGDDCSLQQWLDLTSKSTAANQVTVTTPPEAPQQDRRYLSLSHVWGSPHSSGFNVAMCDGSVHTVNFSINPTVHANLSNRQDRQTIATNAY
jgi:prepilin-type processing-associated H-X9-DG protein